MNVVSAFQEERERELGQERGRETGRKMEREENARDEGAETKGDGETGESKWREEG